MKIQDTRFIHPEDTNNVDYWTKKWGISVRQLKDAILDTGSINITDVKSYLQKNTYQYSPITGFWYAIRSKFIH